MKKLLAIFSECLDLLRTFDRSAKGYKVFGSPNFAGGPATKARQLSAGAAKPGERYSTLICLSAVRVPIQVLKILRARGARIHVNQNGVYYPLWFPVGYQRKNAYLLALSRAATHVFFQSEFARRAFVEWVGPLPVSESVLPNAVDLTKFTPSSRPSDPNRLRVLVFQDFREINRELWEYHLSLLPRVRGVQWVFMGRPEMAPPEGTGAELVLGPSAKEVARVLPTCDLALHFVPNDVCPNKVLECLASGVYVICSSSGGSHELLAHGGGESVPAKEDYEAKHFPDPDAVVAAIERFRARADEKRAEAARAAQKFALPRWIETMTGLN